MQTKITVILILVLTGVFLFPPASVLAQEGEAKGEGIDPFAKLDEICVCVTGDTFNYKRDAGTLVINGNVQVVSSDFTVNCDTLEVISDGREKPVMRAYPSVTMNYANGLAEFQGGEFYFDFNTEEGEIRSVDGVVHLREEDLGMQLDVPLDVYFKANALRLKPGWFLMEKPWMGLGRDEKSDVRFYSLEIAAEIKDGRIVAAEIDRFVMRLFGVKITLLPVRLRHGFVPSGEVGLTGFLPKLTYDSDDGLGINQLFFYTFNATPTDESYMSFRLNPFLFDRVYWEVGLNHSFPDGEIGLFYGPARQVDFLNDSQVVWSKPELRLKYDLPRVGDYRQNLRGYWGDIREASRGVESQRGGFEYIFSFKPAEFGNWEASFNGSYKMNFYDNGDQYRVFKQVVSLGYDGGSDLDFKLSYLNNDDKGETPFFYDRVKVREGVELKSQMFVTDEWGVGSKLLWDLDRDEFEALGVGPIYVFDSLQLGLLWDFEKHIVYIVAGLPKQFN